MNAFILRVTKDLLEVSPVSSAEKEKQLAEALIRLSGGVQSLCLTAQGLGDRSAMTRLAAAISRSQLRYLQLDSSGIDASAAEILAQAITGLTSLQCLDLDCNLVSDRGAAALANAIQDPASNVKELQLHFNGVGVVGACSLGKALQTNQKLQVLSLHGNQQVGLEGAAALAEGLKLNSSLTMLSLHDCHITDAGAAHFADALTHNNTLKELAFGRNCIGDVGAQSLSQMLQVNATLKELELGQNNIKNVGAIRLAEALESNSSLVDLWLVDNPVGSEGIHRLSKALEKNETLMRLGISTVVSEHGNLAEALDIFRRSHRIRQAIHFVEMGAEQLELKEELLGDSGVEMLARAIERSNTLRELRLERCNITDSGAIRLAEAIEKCDAELRVVSLAGNAFSKSAKDRLEDILERSNTIQSLDLSELADKHTPRLYDPPLLEEVDRTATPEPDDLSADMNCLEPFEDDDNLLHRQTQSSSAIKFGPSSQSLAPGVYINVDGDDVLPSLPLDVDRNLNFKHPLTSSLDVQNADQHDVAVLAPEMATTSHCSLKLNLQMLTVNQIHQVKS